VVSVGDGEVGVEQFLVEDPDGYLLRIQSPLGPADEQHGQP